MKARSEAVFRFAAPLRAAMARFAFLSLVAVSFALMLLGKAEVVVVERARTAMLDLLTPVFGVISQPAEAVSSVATEFSQIANVYEENRRLREAGSPPGPWEGGGRPRPRPENSLCRAGPFSGGPPAPPAPRPYRAKPGRKEQRALAGRPAAFLPHPPPHRAAAPRSVAVLHDAVRHHAAARAWAVPAAASAARHRPNRKSTRLNSSKTV